MFVVGKKRSFYVGDAAYRFPAIIDNDCGFNAGIEDIHNLAWKLALVVHRIAYPDSLSSYGTGCGSHNKYPTTYCT